MATTTTTVLDHYNVVPPPEAAVEQSLQLVDFDLAYIPYGPCRTLVFYEMPCSQSEFLQFIVPSIQTSLSLALKHFLPFAGNILFPLDRSSGGPVSQYTAGNSLSLTIAESDADFANLSGNHPKNLDELYNLAPHLPKSEYSSEDDLVKIPVASIQLTLFPNQGICFGMNIHHAIADGATMMLFLRACVHVLGGGDMKTHRPSYDRITSANIKQSALWEPLIKKLKLSSQSDVDAILLGDKKVQATFVVTDAEIANLKNIVMENRPGMGHTSSFTVVCSLVWICMARSVGEEEEDEPAYFTCPVNCRERLNPPLPSDYFGNCVTIVKAETTHRKLKGSGGFIHAVEVIREAIDKALNGEIGILDSFDRKFLEYWEMTGKKGVTSVDGSPKFDCYVAGKGGEIPKKVEPIRYGKISLLKSREFAEGVEVTFSSTKSKMDSFAVAFNKALGKAPENVSN